MLSTLDDAVYCTTSIMANDNDNISKNNSGDFHPSEGAEASIAFSGEEGTQTTSNDFVAQHQASVRLSLIRAKEAHAVSVVRSIIFLVLLMAACAVCLLVYFYGRADEIEDFETEFKDFANKLMLSYTDAVERQLGAVDALSIAITSYALSHGETFPNVTLPNFALRAASCRVMANSVIVLYAPIITEATRRGWESYSTANQNWIFRQSEIESNHRTKQDEKYPHLLEQQQQQQQQSSSSGWDDEEENNVAEEEKEEEKDPRQELGFNAEIFEGYLGHPPIRVAPPNSGPYVPFWQMSPVGMYLYSGLNLNLLMHPAFRLSLFRIMETGKALYSEAGIVESENADPYYFHLMNGQYRYQISEYAGDPTSRMVYPVFNHFEDDKTMVGVLFVGFYFRLYFANALPANARGIVCVIENSYNQTFSYRIDGPDVTYLGDEDLHDPLYDHLVVSNDLMTFIRNKAGPDSFSYTVADLDDEFCGYKLRIYPSNDTAKVFLSEEPMLGAIIVAAVFAITSAVFLLYDFLVERRQNAIVDKAATSGAIVSSLFPKNIKDRLMEENEAGAKANLNTNNYTQLSWLYKNNNNNLVHAAFMGSRSEGTTSAAAAATTTSTTTATAPFSSKPIADLYPNTTVLFQDLAGFTSWSSTRKPEDVFVLLETVYNAFDWIAVKRGVYKIETIGDCYVAVTGLPEPNELHGVNMVKFATDCLHKFKNLTQNELRGLLGEDTSDLQLRVGLHSGPVTGGVLRGQKSRFQLFGDTMNTASRMESNGVKGRIHISQETANELIKKGKSHWIIPREERIVAKGKGEMQTYFVETTAVGKNTVATESLGRETASL